MGGEWHEFDRSDKSRKVFSHTVSLLLSSLPILVRGRPGEKEEKEC